MEKSLIRAYTKKMAWISHNAYRISFFIVFSLAISTLADQSVSENLPTSLSRNPPSVESLLDQKANDTEMSPIDFLKHFKTKVTSDECMKTDKGIITVFCELEFEGLDYAKKIVDEYNPKDSNLKKELSSLKPYINSIYTLNINVKANQVLDLCQGKSKALLDPEWIKSSIKYFNDLKPVGKNNLQQVAIDDRKKVLDCLTQLQSIKTDNEIRQKCVENSTDLSNRFPPVRNQTNSQWCYAHAAANVLSYYEGVDVSAADVAIQKLKEDEAAALLDAELEKLGGSRLKHEKKIVSKADLDSGGFPIKALSKASEVGYCLEKDFPSELLNQKKDFAKLRDLHREVKFISKGQQKIR